MRIASLGIFVILGFALVGLTSCNKAELSGVVVDQIGKPLDGVAVSITNTEFRTKTDPQGRYKLGYIPGRFEVRYEKIDYVPISISLEFTTQSGVPLSQQTLRSDIVTPFSKTLEFITTTYVHHYLVNERMNPNDRVFGALQETKSMFLANLAKAPIPYAVVEHVMTFPAGSTLAMATPAYVKLGFPAIFDFDNSDTTGRLYKIPPEAKEYVAAIGGGDELVKQAIDGSIGLNDPKFLAATNALMLTANGMGLLMSSVLLDSKQISDADLKFQNVDQFRKSIAAKRAQANPRK